MTVKIAPFIINPDYDFKALPVKYKKGRYTERNYPPIVYWGIYLDDKYISHTSNKEQAEKTKTWLEKWLRARA
jgi:hypothetical protein